MSYKYLKSVYKALKTFENENERTSLYNVIQTNEILLNEFAKHMLFATHNLEGGYLGSNLEKTKSDLLLAIEDLLKRCDPQDVEKILKIIRSLLKYIDQLYALVKDVDILKVQQQLNELNQMLETIQL